MDATCCDVEVKYPTDLDVLNDAQEVSERLIDKLCKLSGSPSKEMQTEEYKLQSTKDMGKRNESESTFGTGKRVYNVNDVRAKLPDTADAWTAACFLAKNVMKFLKELLWRLFEKSKLSLGKKFLMMDRIFLIQRPTAA